MRGRPGFVFPPHLCAVLPFVLISISMEERKMKTSMWFSTTLAVAGVVMGFPNSATGGESRLQAEVATEVVDFADLNLSRPEGVSVLYERIRLAARRVCAYDNGTLPLRQRTQQNACYEQAVTDAVAAVNQPLLTSLHGSQPWEKRRRRA